MIPLGVLQGSIQDSTINITGVNTNLNLKDFFELTNPPALPGATIDFIVDAGATINSSDPALPSMRTGAWTPGVIVTLTNLVAANWRGAGGVASGPSPAGQGGTALLVEHPISLDNTAGRIAGGGGGGAGSDQWFGTGPNSGLTYQAGGGGGAGDIVGPGRVVTGSDNTSDGDDGTLELGGDGGDFGSDPNQPSQGAIGGDGGALGMPGSDAADVAQPGSGDNTGGAAGYSIDGFSLVTVIDAGTLLGPTNG